MQNFSTIHKNLRLLHFVIIPWVYDDFKVVVCHDFGLKWFVIIKRLKFGTNIDIMQLYYVKGLLVIFVSGKWNENVMKIYIHHTNNNISIPTLNSNRVTISAILHSNKLFVQKNQLIID